MPGKKRSNKSVRKTQSRKTRVVSMTKKVAVKPLPVSQKASTLDLVRNYISRFAETKFRGKDIVTSVFNGSIASAGEIYGVLPAIPKTTTDSITAHGRLGDYVTPKSLKLNGSIAIVSAQYKRIRVRMFVLTAKSIKNVGQKSSIDIVHLINDGQTDGGVQFDGTVQKRDFPVNTKLFTVLSDRSYDLCSASGTSVTGEPHMPDEGAVGAVPRFINQDDNQKSFVHFNLDLPLPSRLAFTSSSGNDATNYYPFMCIGYTEYDTNPASSTSTEIAVSCNSMLRYDDS